MAEVIKGTIMTRVGGKLKEYLPKTEIGQVMVKEGLNLDVFLDQLVEMVTTATVITDPDLIEENNIYKIENSDKMPTTGTYVIDAMVIDENNQYQCAVSTELKKKYERWKVNGQWTGWTEFKGESLEYRSIEIPKDVLEDTFEIDIPEGIDIERGDQFKLFKNSTFVNKRYYSVENNKVVFTELVHRGTELIFLLESIVKTDIDRTLPLDGSIISPGTIPIEAMNQDAYAKPLRGLVDPEDNTHILTPKMAARMLEANIVASEELCILEHNMNRYVGYSSYVYEDGAGIGGAGYTPAGGTNPISINLRVEVLDKNRLKLYASSLYMEMGAATIRQMDERAFVISFENTNVNIMIIIF